MRRQNHARGRVSAIRAVVASLLLAIAGSAGSQTLLEDPTRLPDDHERDAGSRPLAVYGHLGIAEGDTVLDVLPGDGYNTHLLSRIVGDSGRVLAFCPPPLDIGGACKPAALRERIADAGLANVEFVERLDTVATDSVAVALSIRNVHDFYVRVVVERFELSSPEELFAGLLRVLEPGGTLGVVDARTELTDVDEQAHRISEAVVRRDVEAAGFGYVDASELLRDPDDDHATPSFGNRFHVDRMFLRFRKPGAS